MGRNQYSNKHFDYNLQPNHVGLAGVVNMTPWPKDVYGTPDPDVWDWRTERTKATFRTGLRTFSGKPKQPINI